MLALSLLVACGSLLSSILKNFTEFGSTMLAGIASA